MMGTDRAQPGEPGTHAAAGATRAPRADARRNIAAILAAGEECLVRNPEASMSEIARTAGVGRVTLYGHFPSRAELVDGVFARVLEGTEQTLAVVDTSGDPAAALRRLVDSSWRIVHQFRAVLVAAQRELPADQIRRHHRTHLDRFERLLDRGQRSGVFRQDLPADWLVTVCMTLMHTAAEEVLAGTRGEDDAGAAVVETVLSTWRVPS